MSFININKLNLTDNFKNDNNIYNKKYLFQMNEKLNNIINNIKLLIFDNIDDSITKTLNSYFHEINEIIERLMKSFNSLIISKDQIETIQRKDEQNLRILYGKLFHEKLLNEIHENRIYMLNQREKELELLKQKTGAIICNGKVICNERKDNEIIILRTENSLLKTAIKNNEDLLKEKNNLINTLNKDILFYKAQIDELRHTKTHEFSSFSNININFNESKKNFNNNKNSSINSNKPSNSIEISSSSKKTNSIKRCKNNIYSSYQINSQLINKINNTSTCKNKNKNKKEEYQTNTNLYKDTNKNNTIDSNGYTFKYISVNKSLFNPIYDLKRKANKKKFMPSKKKNFFKNNIPSPNYNTISNELSKRKEIKLKKNLNNQVWINHRKANSIQYLNKKANKLNMNSQVFKEKSLSNAKNNVKNKNLQSVLKKISDIKNIKKNYESLSMTVDNLKRSKQKISKKNIKDSVLPYIEMKNNIKGRNDKMNTNSKITNNNSCNFMSKTTYNYYPNSEKLAINYLNN